MFLAESCVSWFFWVVLWKRNDDTMVVFLFWRHYRNKNFRSSSIGISCFVAFYLLLYMWMFLSPRGLWYPFSNFYFRLHLNRNTHTAACPSFKLSRGDSHFHICYFPVFEEVFLFLHFHNLSAFTSRLEVHMYTQSRGRRKYLDSCAQYWKYLNRIFFPHSPLPSSSPRRLLTVTGQAFVKKSPGGTQ